MALYVTRPRRDEERIGRGLPSDDLCKHNATYCRYRYISTQRYFGTSLVIENQRALHFQENLLDYSDRKLYHISTSVLK